MANQEHLAILRQGVAVWNQWKEENPEVEPDLRGASLIEASLRGVNLRATSLVEANLRGANLRGANLRWADLARANLGNANLRGADLGNANLQGARFGNANLRSVALSYANLKGASLSYTSLRHAHLVETDFSKADLSNADLSNANLSNANLRKANLFSARAFNADFSNATFTGACLENWQLNRETNFSDVQCKYVYQRWNATALKFTDRLPADPTSTFARGEFAQRFRIPASALDTFSLSFTQGIDWPAFFAAVQTLRTQHPRETLAIQGMECKGNVFILRLTVAENTNKSAFETELKQLYQAQLQLAGAKYQAELQVEDREIEQYRKHSADLMELAKLLAASQPSGDGQGKISVQYNCPNPGPVGSIGDRGTIHHAANQVIGNQISVFESANHLSGNA